MKLSEFIRKVNLAMLFRGAILAVVGVGLSIAIGLWIPTAWPLVRLTVAVALAVGWDRLVHGDFFWDERDEVG